MAAKARPLHVSRCRVDNHGMVMLIFCNRVRSTTGTFLTFVRAPWFAINSSVAVPIVFALLFVFTLGTLFCAAFMEPGYLPKYDVPQLVDLPALRPSSSNTNADSYPFAPSLPQLQFREIHLMNDEHTLRLKYCDTCNFFRPPRASHCHVCDRCVEIHDHHCPWLSNCVGSRNYRVFFVFLWSVSLLCIYAWTMSLFHLVTAASITGTDFATVVGGTPGTILLLFFTFVMSLSLVGMGFYHCRLAAMNMTTHEQIRYSLARDQVPHVYGENNTMLRNCQMALCRPLTRPHPSVEQEVVSMV